MKAGEWKFRRTAFTKATNTYPLSEATRRGIIMMTLVLERATEARSPSHSHQTSQTTTQKSECKGKVQKQRRKALTPPQVRGSRGGGQGGTPRGTQGNSDAQPPPQVPLDPPTADLRQSSLTRSKHQRRKWVTMSTRDGTRREGGSRGGSVGWIGPWQLRCSSAPPAAPQESIEEEGCHIGMHTTIGDCRAREREGLTVWLLFGGSRWRHHPSSHRCARQPERESARNTRGGVSLGDAAYSMTDSEKTGDGGGGSGAAGKEGERTRQPLARSFFCAALVSGCVAQLFHEPFERQLILGGFDTFRGI